MNLRIKVLGSGPIYDETIATCEAAGAVVTREEPFDLVILANVLRILGKDEIANPRLGVLCFHPSLLPRHRGSDAVYWTLKMGDRRTGITWFWIDEGVDTGPIAAQAAIDFDSRGDLTERALPRTPGADGSSRLAGIAREAQARRAPKHTAR